MASQSSSSGWLGHSPCEPKFSAVLTRPMPKELLPEAVDRDAGGERIAGSTIHCARPSRLIGAPLGSGGRTRGQAGVTLSPCLSYCAAHQHEGIARFGISCHHHHASGCRLSKCVCALPARLQRARQASTDCQLACVGAEIGARSFFCPGVALIARSADGARESRSARPRRRRPGADVRSSRRARPEARPSWCCAERAIWKSES